MIILYHISLSSVNDFSHFRNFLHRENYVFM